MQQVKIVGIIQARLGSIRLPYKMLLSLHGHPIIKWVVCRAGQSKRLDDLVVAIPDNAENDVLNSYLHKLKAEVFRGPEDDVLKRFYLAAKESQATHIVRICADNPLISGKEIDHLIEFYFANPCDYAYNHIPMGNTYPDGLGAEIISFDLLEYLEKNAVEPEHREHCFSYITDHTDHFSIKTFNSENKRIACPELKLDIDTFEDYQRLAMKDFDIDTSAEELVKILK
jgi:spore coat polysaccharide biosynthesis protein SpsF